MTKKELTEILGSVRKVFPNYVLETEALELWYALFETYHADDFLTAILSAVKEPGRQFFPTPGEVNKYLEAASGQIAMTAGEAWNLVYKSCFQEQRIFLEKHFDNQPLVIATQQIGLRRIALADIGKELPFLRKEFIRTYEQNLHKSELNKNFYISKQQATRMLNSINGILPDKTKPRLLK
jgi:hypothetical protein